MEKTLLLLLARSGIHVLSELGYEVDGVPISIAWPDYPDGVVVDSDGHAELQAPGWTAVGTDVKDIRGLLKVKGPDLALATWIKQKDKIEPRLRPKSIPFLEKLQRKLRLVLPDRQGNQWAQ
jgi:hypothetical protein